jgi:hypothetical protein
MNEVAEIIDSFAKETNESFDEVVLGSDEHLDSILKVTTPLGELTRKFEKFNDDLWVSLSKSTDEELRSFLPSLQELNRSCISVIGALRTFRYYSHIKDTFRNYYAQWECYRELIHDIDKVRLSKNDDIDKALSFINTL